ncbi:hypothetical protein [Pseudomonas agarici]|uniref:hypothetical protein n=1 Tax=Pseudomonas agarici TaxID=46677 RepID=UPI0008AAE7B3|nr:hypothetical protein [Pseudomonas agarici]NWB90216.1 hypothetical protein [Pseudomonas agarici]NWC08853.1 hypothetical protein [Pseudomonas agarici]SEK59628.1 hypothetical protein SAMN05216604_104189 [Pseudomonas agarici]
MRITNKEILLPSAWVEKPGNTTLATKTVRVGNSSSGIEVCASPKSDTFNKVPMNGSAYPEDLNPFAGKVDEYPDGINPFVDAAETSSQALNPFENETDTADSTAAGLQEVLPSAPRLDVTFGAPLAFIQMINTYLRTRSDGSFQSSNNSRHVDKLSKDINQTPALAQFLVMKGEKGKEAVEWKGEPPSKEEFQQMLQAFKPLHKVKGSFYTLLTHFDFAGAGYRLLDDGTHERIIRKAAEPDLHRPGKGAVVDMKRKAMTDVLEHFSDPLRRDEPVPEGLLDELIAHYGRVEKDQDQARLSAQKLAENSNLSLNDSGFGDALARFFRRVKTGERLGRFNNEVAATGEKLRGKMFENLERIHRQHEPQAVAVRTKTMLEKHLRKAHDEYAKEMKGRNIYPDSIGAETAGQINGKAEENFQQVLRSVVFSYEKAFVEGMAKAVSSFSPPDYFQGKSLGRSVDNIININDNLSDLHRVAQAQHKADIHEVKSRFGEKAVVGLSTDFQALQLDFAGRIKQKVLSNYGDVLQRYEKKLDKLRQATPSDSLHGKLKLARELAVLSKQSAADLDKIRTHRHAEHLQLQPAELEQVLQKAAQPIQEKVTELLPKPMGIKGMLKSIIVRPFKPTVKNIAIGAAVAGVSTLALVALPAVIAGPVGVALIVGLSVAVVGWFGRNIYRSLSQSHELNKLLTQIGQPRSEVENRDKA